MGLAKFAAQSADSATVAGLRTVVEKEIREWQEEIRGWREDMARTAQYREQQLDRMIAEQQFANRMLWEALQSGAVLNPRGTLNIEGTTPEEHGD